MIKPFLLIACLSTPLLLTACGGGSNPESGANTGADAAAGGSGGGNTGGGSTGGGNTGGGGSGSGGGNAGGGNGDSNPPQTSTTVCDQSPADAHFCDQTIASPAPPASGGTVARPGANGVADCEADWPAGGATTNIAATVFIPPHNEGDTLPLILHSHGWGGRRVSNADTPRPTAGANTFGGIDAMVPELWRQGYLVISFDQRGWGGSEGQAEVIDPCYETVDAIAIVDWALANLPVATTAGNDPVLGTIGGSYGGAYQMMLAAMDDRVDAIMPVATWNNLATAQNELLEDGARRDPVPGGLTHAALINNEIAKSGYIQGLCLLANLAGRDSGLMGATLNPLITQACTAVQSGAVATGASGATLDNLNPQYRVLFNEHGMGNANLRAGRPPMNVDVLLFQGMRDMVFDGIEAYDNLLFFSDPANNNASADVRLITTDGGHMLTTYAQVNPGYQIQGENDCGSVDMFDSMLAWFDNKLRSGPAHGIPEICIALDSDAGVQLNDVPIGNPEGAFAIGDAANPVFVTQTTATNVDLLGSPRQFLSLMTMQESGYIAGMPILRDVKVEAAGPAAVGPLTVVIPAGVDATAFVAVGIRKASDGSLLEVDDQITPIRRSNGAGDAAVTHNDLRMALVGDQLAVGDEVGLLLYQRNGYFQVQPGVTTEYQTNAYAIHGNIEIPIFNSAGTALGPNSP